MRIYDPTGTTEKTSANDTLLVKGGLAGKTVGILSNVWPSFEEMIVHFREELIEKHQVSRINYYEIPRTRAAPDELLERVVAECDAAIVGLGN